MSKLLSDDGIMDKENKSLRSREKEITYNIIYTTYFASVI